MPGYFILPYVVEVRVNKLIELMSFNRVVTPGETGYVTQCPRTNNVLLYLKKMITLEDSFTGNSCIVIIHDDILDSNFVNEEYGLESIRFIQGKDFSTLIDPVDLENLQGIYDFFVNED